MSGLRASDCRAVPDRPRSSRESFLYWGGIAFLLGAIAGAFATALDHASASRSFAPCSDFGNRSIDDVPARCRQYFEGHR